jgi:hypothetical protein
MKEEKKNTGGEKIESESDIYTRNMELQNNILKKIIKHLNKETGKNNNKTKQKTPYEKIIDIFN